MITDIFHIILWVTVILLVVSGIDDMFMDILFWFNRRRYKKDMPSFSEMTTKPERPIAIMIGAWQEDKVIGRTLSIALKKLRYENYRFFLAVYPNDLKTVKVVREIARKDQRVVLCLNPQDGPTTKADNLNNAFTCVKEYERQFGEFDVILIHDAEDFIHPLSLKLYNYLIMYKGNYAVQIPVIPIKSRLGKMFHRTMCDAFAELHTKDMIVRQSIGSYIPFAGTGMAFNRKAFHYLESQSVETEKRQDVTKKTTGKTTPVYESDVMKHYSDQELEDIKRLNESKEFQEEDPYPQYDDIAIPGYDDEEQRKNLKKSGSHNLRMMSLMFVLMVFLGGIFVLFVNNATTQPSEQNSPAVLATLKNQSNPPVNNSLNTTNNIKPPVNNNNVINQHITNAITETNITSNPDANTSSDLVNFDINNILMRNPNVDLNVVIDEYKDGSIKVQESAYSTLEQAQIRHSLIKGLVKDSRVVIGKSGNSYRIIIGDFRNMNDAKIMAQNLRNKVK
ncbi:MAG TPA: glycosyltransferase [Ignavibacteria bacterium]|nr:glycosyltransferase [Ignavibacteria bacterium]